MSPSHNSKIKSITLVVSVAIIALVFGIMLDDKVVPDAKKSLMTEEAAEKNSNKDAEVDKEIKQILQEQATKRRKEQSVQIEQLDQKADVTIEKADGIISQTDELISKAGLPEPVSNKSTLPQNKEIPERLAKARERLDALKNKKSDKNPGEI